MELLTINIIKGSMGDERVVGIVPIVAPVRFHFQIQKKKFN